MRTSSLLAAAAALSSALAAPSSETHALHEKRTEGHGFVKRSRVERSAILPMRIALTQQNLDDGEKLVMDVSDPKSLNYGKHWTAEQVHRRFSPSKDTAQAVVDWLTSNGIEQSRISHSDHKTWLAFDATADEAEKLFGTEFYEHEHEESGRVSIGSDEYYLPHHLVEHIDYIKPGVVQANMRKRSSPLSNGSPDSYRHHSPPSWYPTGPPSWWWQWFNGHHNHPPGPGGIPADLVNCSKRITAPCLRSLYKFPEPSGPVSSKNSIGVFEEMDTYSQGDLDSFFTTFLPQVPNGTHPIPAYIDGAVAPVPVADAGGESMLDLTLIYPIIYPQTITLYQTDDPIYATEALNGTLNGFLDTFLDALDGSFCTYSAYGQTGNNNTLDPVYPDPNPGGYKGPLQCGVYKPTNVISISYLGGEYALPVNYMRRQCNEFMKLALQGHTVVFASGDYGVASFPTKDDPTGQCYDVNGKKLFAAEFPATCPWVVGVGATQLPINGTIYEPEQAVKAIFGNGAPYTSSGGFSNVFPIPAYQKLAVEEYFAFHSPPYPYYKVEYGEGVGRGQHIGANGGLYNRLGRGFPDLAANGRWWVDFLNGKEVLYGGTSMSAPIVAGLINRINEERIKIGKGPVGFINPALYFNPWLLTDIYSGNNLGCGTDGFNATRGWDPVTGGGTPKYPEMLQFFKFLP